MISFEDRVHPSWLPALTPVAETLNHLARALADERDAGFEVLPPADVMMSALSRPSDDVSVVILGQDPYPTPGHAMGLAFSVARQVTVLPRSLANIYRELVDDIGVPHPTHGDLSSWADQGVLLLNRCLSVRAGDAGSHQGIGWEHVTTAILHYLTTRDRPLVAILWGRWAQQVTPLLGDTPIIASAHPSPLSARRGFFGSKPFSRCNTLLDAQDVSPINWAIPD